MAKKGAAKTSCHLLFAASSLIIFYAGKATPALKIMFG